MGNPDEAPSSTSMEIGSPGFHEQLDELYARMRQLREAEANAQASLHLVADLETAYEELRVADEEVRTQQEEIAKLRERHDALHWHHDRMLAILPVPALVTDAVGVIRSANAAAAALAGIGVVRLAGRPVFSLFAIEDRRALRDLVTEHASSQTHRTATVVPRAGAPVTVEVSVSVSEGDQVEVTWLLLARDTTDPERRLRILHQALTELAGLPGPDVGVRDVLDRAAQVCRRTIGEVEVSINLGAPDAPDALASTSVLAQTLDGAQLRAGEGPSRTALETRQPVSSPDLRADQRWPRLSRLLPAQQVSAVAVPIEVGERLVGHLNVYGLEGEPLGHVEDVEMLAATLGTVCYELELAAELDRLSEDLRRAVSSRAVIEQAKGIVMAQKRCSPEEAFAHLAQLSSTQERKLRDVAQTIVETVSDRG
jgi:PAS domain S-box-containing protein